jgi:hypothetical protein
MLKYWTHYHRQFSKLWDPLSRELWKSNSDCPLSIELDPRSDSVTGPVKRLIPCLWAGPWDGMGPTCTSGVEDQSPRSIETRGNVN